MEFTLLRAHEAPTAPSDRTAGDSFGIAAQLLDGSGAVLVAAAPVVTSAVACSPRANPPGIGLLRVVLARHPDARLVELRAHGRVIFSAPIGIEGPVATAIVMDPAPPGSVAGLRIDPPPQPADDVRFFVVDETGRRFNVTPAFDDGRYAIDLAPYAGRGSARIAAEITRELRTVTAHSQRITLAPAGVRGRILEPSDASEWCADTHGSLMANLADANGRAIPWDPQRVTWVIDGRASEETRQIAVRDVLAPGEHRIELHYRHGDGATVVLDRVQIVVRAKTAMEKEYDALLADFLGSRSTPAPPQAPVVAPAPNRWAPARSGCGCGGH